ncbi:MAG TPA: sialidase family protein, partial [Candidatus Thermoplasmatota archaeon]|nr:sialidase family protein [Candidatus Thermoplasmatota archaeon]
FPNGTVLVTWVEPAVEAGILKSRLLYEGKEWGPIQTLAPSVGLAGPPVHDPGAPTSLYLPYFTRGLFVAASQDGGKSWQATKVAGPFARGFVGHGEILFPVAAVDEAGTVYVAWAGPQESPLTTVDNAAARSGIFLSHSIDGGKTWSPPRLLSSPDRTAIFAWMSAGAPGRVVVTWYENRNGVSDLGADLWDVALVESVTADQDDPLFLGGHLNTGPVHVGQICGLGLLCTAGDRSRGDFFANAIKRDGHPVVAWVADSETPGIVDVMVGGVAEGTPLR